MNENNEQLFVLNKFGTGQPIDLEITQVFDKPISYQNEMEIALFDVTLPEQMRISIAEGIFDFILEIQMLFYKQNIGEKCSLTIEKIAFQVKQTFLSTTHVKEQLENLNLDIQKQLEPLYAKNWRENRFQNSLSIKKYRETYPKFEIDESHPNEMIIWLKPGFLAADFGNRTELMTPWLYNKYYPNEQVEILSDIHVEDGKNLSMDEFKKKYFTEEQINAFDKINFPKTPQDKINIAKNFGKIELMRARIIPSEFFMNTFKFKEVERGQYEWIDLSFDQNISIDDKYVDIKYSIPKQKQILPDILYVYADIIQPSYINSKKANYLRSFQYKKSAEHDLLLGKLLFVPLRVSEINSITVDIRDISGSKIYFENGVLTVTLIMREISQ